MIIRYVIGRPEAPAEPKILKAGGVSKDARRDTTLALYLAACDDQEVPPDAGYVEHLRARDKTAWVYSVDMFASPDLVAAALDDAKRIQARIARMRTSSPPERNAWQCSMCRWRHHCEGDPTGSSFDHWAGLEDRQPLPELVVRVGKAGRGNLLRIDRSRPGYACRTSELRAASTCPRLWWIEYCRRRQQERISSVGAKMLIGTITHRLIELKTRQPSTNLATEARLLVTELIAGEAVTQDVADQLADPGQVQAFAHRAEEMHAAAMVGVDEVLEVEARRAMVLPGTKKWLHGAPDAVVRFTDGSVGVVEYKTTVTSKNLEKVADRYRSNPSVHMYAALVQRGRLTL